MLHILTPSSLLKDTRYDSLLDHFKEPAQQMRSRRVYGVSMSIAVESGKSLKAWLSVDVGYLVNSPGLSENARAPFPPVS